MEKTVATFLNFLFEDSSFSLVEMRCFLPGEFSSFSVAVVNSAFFSSKDLSTLIVLNSMYLLKFEYILNKVNV